MIDSLHDSSHPRNATDCSSCCRVFPFRPVCCAEKPQVTGTGGEEQPDAAPTPTPAPAGAPDPTPAPAAGVGGLVGAIKNAVTGHGSSSGGDTAAVPGTSATDEAPPADAAPGMLGNLTSSISSAAHTVTDAASSTISSAAHTVTDAASGIMGHKKDGDAAVPAAGDGAATEKEGDTSCLLSLFFVYLHVHHRIVRHDESNLYEGYSLPFSVSAILCPTCTIV